MEKEKGEEMKRKQRKIYVQFPCKPLKNYYFYDQYLKKKKKEQNKKKYIKIEY